MLRWCLVALLMVVCGLAHALTFSNAYLSPRNKERAIRKSTQYIILHTTEAPALSSLRKLSKNGEAHYCVDRDGKVYRIINRTRVAYHCGTSMWKGQRNIDNASIGIEVVGYHDKALTLAQYTALRELIQTLQKIYSVKDANVMAHAQVAYGNPNRWHRKRHRGRKRCGMGYATPSVRKLLGLKERWLSDPDVNAKRLVVGDAFLAQILYGKNNDKLLPYKLPKANEKSTPVLTEKLPERVREITIAKGMTAWDVARDAYNAATTLYTFPNGKTLSGDKIVEWDSIVVGTKVRIGSPTAGSPVQTLLKGQNPRQLIGDAVFAADTWYIRPNGGRIQGSSLKEKTLAALPPGTKILVGYAVGGPVTGKRLPSHICPTQWDAQDTFYLLPGKPLQPFGKVDMKRIPAGTYIFYRN